MGQYWRRLKRAIQPRISQRFTSAGFWFTILVLLTGTAAFVSGNNLIFLILSALLATLLVSGNLNRLTLSGLEVEFHPPEHLFARRSESGRFVVRNTKWWFPSFALRLSSRDRDGMGKPVFIPLIASGEAVEFYADVRFDRRGLYRENGFQFTSRFPFGFAERRAKVTLLADVLVYPELRSHHLENSVFAELLAEAEARRRGRGTEFHQLRPYHSQEDARHIDWRSSARHGEMYLREFAVEEQQDVELWLDLGGWDPIGFEVAVRAVATHLFELTRLGINVRVKTQEREMAVPAETDVYGVLAYLAVLAADRSATPMRAEDKPENALLLYYAWDLDRVPDELLERVVTRLDWFGSSESLV